MLYNHGLVIFSRVDIENVQKILFKAKRWRLVNDDCYLTGMLVNLYNTLFNAAKCSTLPLNNLLTIPREQSLYIFTLEWAYLQISVI